MKSLGWVIGIVILILGIIVIVFIFSFIKQVKKLSDRASNVSPKDIAAISKMAAV